MGGRSTTWGMIDAETIVFPLAVEGISAAILYFTVPREAAQAYVPGAGFEIEEPQPGQALLVLAVAEYRESPLGPYNTLSVGPLVRPVGAPDQAVGPFLLSSPVSQRVSFEVVHRALGLATSVEEIDVAYGEDEATFRLASGGRLALRVRVPRVRPVTDPTPTEAPAYTAIDGEPQVMPVRYAMPFGGVVDPDAAEVELGTGWLPDTLRRLGLPRTPEACLWGEGLSAVFHLPGPTTPASPR